MLRTKAPVTTDELGDQYCMLGLYKEERVKLEVCLTALANITVNFVISIPIINVL